MVKPVFKTQGLPIYYLFGISVPYLNMYFFRQFGHGDTSSHDSRCLTAIAYRYSVLRLGLGSGMEQKFTESDIGL